MMGKTHLVIGAAAGLGVGVAMGADWRDMLILTGVAALAALLPDIDHPNGSIRQKMGFLGHIGLFWLSHRGITHTLLALAVVELSAFYFLPYALALAVALGYLSHLVADMVTRNGLPILWPLYRRHLHLLPRPLRISTGGIIETMIFFAVVFLMGFSILYRVYEIPDLYALLP